MSLLLVCSLGCEITLRLSVCWWWRRRCGSPFLNAGETRSRNSGSSNPSGDRLASSFARCRPSIASGRSIPPPSVSPGVGGCAFVPALARLAPWSPYPPSRSWLAHLYIPDALVCPYPPYHSRPALRLRPLTSASCAPPPALYDSFGGIAAAVHPASSSSPPAGSASRTSCFPYSGLAPQPRPRTPLSPLIPCLRCLEPETVELASPVCSSLLIVWREYSALGVPVTVPCLATILEKCSLL